MRRSRPAWSTSRRHRARADASTDSGNAEDFTARYGDDLRYDWRRLRWFVWTGHRWQPDADAAVQRRAKAAMRQRLHDASRLEDGDERARLAKWALSSESRGRLDASAVPRPRLNTRSRTRRHWDAHPMLRPASRME